MALRQQLCGLLSHSRVIVVDVSAKDEERSIVRGLEAGADDYLVKPVRQAELVARVAAVLRRTTGARPEQDELNVSPYSLNLVNKTVSLNGEPVALTNREFELALFLFRNAGKMVSRGHLLEAIWGIENQAVSTRTVDTHVSRLRKKLRLSEEHGWVLASIYQHGYRMEKVAVH